MNAQFHIKNWEKFQHYKKRNPPWIKLHKELLDDFVFQRLPLASRALAPMLWLLASESKDGSISADLETLAFRLRTTPEDMRDAIKPLIDKEFVQDDSKALAPRKQDATPETEAETKKKKPYRASKKTNPKTKIPPDWYPTAKQIGWAWDQASTAGVELNWKQEADQCIDHHKKVGSVFADWDAAWRTWVRNAIKFKLEKPHGNQHHGNGAGRPSAHDTLLAAGARAAASRHDEGTGEHHDPDGDGTGDASGTSAGIPRIP